MKLSELEDKVKSQCKGETLMRLSPASSDVLMTGLSSGSMELNYELSGNPFVGFAWGRIVEVYGPEQSGKTTLALHIIKEAQRIQAPALYVDAEHACDPKYMERGIGIDLGELTFNQPNSGEGGLNIVEAAVDAGYKVIVVDSVAALVPQAEIDGEMGQSHVGLQARLMSQAMRKLAGKVMKKGAIVVFINQIRFKVGVMFGNPETQPGGNALRFYSSYRLDVRSPRGGKVEGNVVSLLGSGDEVKEETGIRTKIHVVKNKCYPPFRRAEFTINYGKGIDKVLDAVDFLEHNGFFVMSDELETTEVEVAPKKGAKKGTAPEKKKVTKPKLVFQFNGGTYDRKQLIKLLTEDEKLRPEVTKVIKKKMGFEVGKKK